MENIYVIIVSYNGMNWIATCLESVMQSTFPLTVVVIDNNSKDDTVSFINENYPNVKLFSENVNHGFGAANNIGINYALKNDATAVFLLNQDTKINEDTIEKLLYLSNKFPSYGIFSPLQLDYSGQFLEECFYYFVTNYKNNSFISDAVLRKPMKEVYDVSFIQAASWFMPSKTLKIVGSFDPLFFHYGEDNNYCQRVIYHGLKIGVTPLTSIQHDSTAKLSSPKPIFSADYFKDFELSIKLKYANVLREFRYSDLKSEIFRNLKNAVKSLVKLNFTYFKGYLKKAIILNKNRERVFASRTNNITKK